MRAKGVGRLHDAREPVLAAERGELSGVPTFVPDGHFGGVEAVAEPVHLGVGLGERVFGVSECFDEALVAGVV